MTRRRLNMRSTNKRIGSTIMLLLLLAGHVRGQTQEAVAELKKLNAQFSGHRYEFTMAYNTVHAYVFVRMQTRSAKATKLQRSLFSLSEPFSLSVLVANERLTGSTQALRAHAEKKHLYLPING